MFVTQDIYKTCALTSNAVDCIVLVIVMVFIKLSTVNDVKVQFLENVWDRGKYSLSEREFLWNKRLKGNINIQKTISRWSDFYIFGTWVLCYCLMKIPFIEIIHVDKVHYIRHCHHIFSRNSCAIWYNIEYRQFEILIVRNIDSVEYKIMKSW